mmetsp:Transcript_5297/g.8613  ORF Transcript_5297/g.8613 Transcript_5297/m.8613 type:complete len:194 (+) Transcript_5297:67-648(+)
MGNGLTSDGYSRGFGPKPLRLRLLDRVFCRYQGRVLLLGLDEAGKTTMLCTMQSGSVVESRPTIGSNQETVYYRGTDFSVVDAGGQAQYRPLWRHLYQHVIAIFFVIDSTAPKRMAEAKTELWALMAEEELGNMPLLVFANKQDLATAMTVQQVSDQLGLSGLQGRQWHVQASCAHSGDGLCEGFAWLSRVIA